MRDISPWMALVALVMLVASTTAAFVDFEMNRAAADAARTEAGNARVACLYGSRPLTTAERKQRHARCAALPGPLREAARVKRRWNERAPWYGFAAGATLVATAAMFVQAKRRRATAGTLERPPARRWRVATIAVRVAVGLMIWSALVYLAADRWWVRLVEATGGSTHDCHYPENACGVLGEFAEAHPLILLILVVSSAAIPAAAAALLLTRVFGSLRASR
jgi:hypothetical protein